MTTFTSGFIVGALLVFVAITAITLQGLWERNVKEEDSWEWDREV